MIFNKRFFAFFVAVTLLFLCAVNTKTYAQKNEEISVSAEACVLYCPDNGQIIFSKNENSSIKPASTTKIMTSLLALEYSQSNDLEVEFTKEMVAEGSSMYLKVGDVLHLSDLAKGMMSASGNDAANAVALTLSDTTDDFSELMNSRAKQIGMKNTNFVTPSGLDDENHYSTAYDMALLMSYALENESFCEITKQKSVQISFVKPESQKNTYQNHNRLLSLYQYCIGGKTGFTKAAGRCLVTASQKDGITLVAATFNAPDDWDDHINLYNYGFEHLKKIECDDNSTYEVSVVGGEKDKVEAKVHIKTSVVVENGEDLKIEKKVVLPKFSYAPINKGDKLGYIEYLSSGKSIGKSDLYSCEAVEYKNADNKFLSFFKGIFN